MNDTTKLLDKLIEILCAEREESVPCVPENQKFTLFRALVNIRMPKEVSEEFLQIQNQYLQAILKQKEITNIADLSPIMSDIYLWQGDITTFKCDGIVNAANAQMLGCFCPNHGCIDNAIHTFAGVQLRLECANIMIAQGKEESVGQAKITSAYNLPCRYILHTVGPMVVGELTKWHEQQLASCYRACLKLADENNLKSLAFCCISTGEFHFPNKRAAEIAIQAVSEYKQQTQSKIKVVFNVFKGGDYDIYTKLLRTNK
ncbi:protein-ADP-ribose hydrolase [Helicobacter sp. MIT 05-5293]|uniref:protein-ADP-ribose hydrolase n=1 Tax=Helicobacter sp. MIT 05-5293 TaxID=1548149 RepID=UPI00051D1EB2|nr:protein-ADP-ribose hydrolase [Helicobacter sp. MIT 05-5293]TLD81536.1 protein-ADP-ribose hydrolase [Helicobacter sp. MIT 05-5293]